jgi:6-phosphogluconate dehydrogenase
MGVSGGEEGALNGPSLMPGGDPDAWPIIQPIMQAIAAKAKDNKPCCEWVGQGGAGHFVKTVHNGIEYGDIQLICEAYDILKRVGRLSNDEMAAAFRKWNTTELDSYLIEITADILSKKDEEGNYVLDTILDVAGQKGTGKWTVSSGVELGVPINVITEAVFARYMSANIDLRRQAAEILAGDDGEPPYDIEKFVDDVKTALCTAKVISYAQGFDLIRAKSQEAGWKLDYAGIARSWRGGCIIRSVFLDKIAEAYTEQPDLPHLLFAPYFSSSIKKCQSSLRRVICEAGYHSIAIPGMSASMSYYDALRCPRSPANMLQAMRDYFGAHTYERIDKPRGQTFHTDWTGHGGSTTAGTYNA